MLKLVLLAVLVLPKGACMQDQRVTWPGQQAAFAKLCKWGVCFAVLLLAACNGKPIYTEGVPHLLAVPGFATLWRSGQPTDASAIRYIADGLHVNRVVKLDTYSEGPTDTLFGLHGVAVDYVPIAPSTKPQSLDEYIDILTGPSTEEWAQLLVLAKQVASRKDNWLVHCVNGNDRTGAFVGLVLVLDGAKPRDAYSYMLATGFHWQLAGLANGWWETVNKLELGQ
jgi:hypothetical protein